MRLTFDPEALASLIWTGVVQTPELSGVRGTIYFVLFLVYLYFGWFFPPKGRSST